jgi:hypothetical protein
MSETANGFEEQQHGLCRLPELEELSVLVDRATDFANFFLYLCISLSPERNALHLCALANLEFFFFFLNHLYISFVVYYNI